jgi:hypothetical protein
LTMKELSKEDIILVCLILFGEFPTQQFLDYLYEHEANGDIPQTFTEPLPGIPPLFEPKYDLHHRPLLPSMNYGVIPVCRPNCKIVTTMDATITMVDETTTVDNDQPDSEDAGPGSINSIDEGA